MGCMLLQFAYVGNVSGYPKEMFFFLSFLISWLLCVVSRVFFLVFRYVEVRFVVCALMCISALRNAWCSRGRLCLRLMVVGFAGFGLWEFGLRDADCAGREYLVPPFVGVV